MNELLTCSHCGETKERECFSLRDKRNYRFRKTCRTCQNEMQRNAYYERKKNTPFVFKHNKLSTGARQKGLDYDLSPEFLKFIWTGKCPISGEEIYISTNAEDRANENSAELDRFVPEKGYVKGNVTWVSRKFNRKKLDSNLQELKMLVSWLETHEPAKEGFSEIVKPKHIPWNKGIKTPGSTEIGEANPTSKMKEEQVVEILSNYTGKRGQIVFYAKRFNVSPSTIRKIVRRQTWKHLEI